MTKLVTSCPRCGAQEMTFEVKCTHFIDYDCTPEEFNDASLIKAELNELRSLGEFVDPNDYPEIMRIYEAFCICQNPKCGKTTIFVVKALEDLSVDESTAHIAEIVEYISQKHLVVHRPLKHVPENIKSAFKEGETCLAVECFNAAGTMFRLCVDLAITSAFAKELEELNFNERNPLGERIDILFKKNHLPSMLHELSNLIKEDGNYGAHKGTLRKKNADLLDLTDQLLQHLYTTPKVVEHAKKRRAKNKSTK